MYDSLTSTWISSESMSTMVPMPVRVKPPPAEIGEIISPGCADFVTTTPLKGARMTVLSSCTSATDRKSTRLNSSHVEISYAVFCLKKKKINQTQACDTTDCTHAV